MTKHREYEAEKKTKNPPSTSLESSWSINPVNQQV